MHGARYKDGRPIVKSLMMFDKVKASFVPMHRCYRQFNYYHHVVTCSSHLKGILQSATWLHKWTKTCQAQCY